MSILDIQVVNLGIYPNDGTGDDLRTAFVKANENFASIDEHVILDGVSLGNGVPVFNNKLGNSLQFRSLESANNNMSISYDSGKITLVVVDSINAVEEDPAPKLGGTLNLNGNDIIGFGNITINGSIDASAFTGNLLGNVTGDLLGNVTGDLLGNVTGDLLGNVTGNVTGDLLGNVTGDLLGNVTGNVTGDLLGNVTGTVSDINNHIISELSDVSGDTPVIGQVLQWTGTYWTPSGIALSSLTDTLVSDPIENQVLQYNGTKWVNADIIPVPTPEVQDFDFGVLGKNITNPTELLLQSANIDFNDGYSLDLQGSVPVLSSSSAIVVEGSAVTITLFASVPDGTLVPYTITGISADDITNTGLTGAFVVFSGTSSLTLLTAINGAEGDRVLTLTLDNVAPQVSISITIAEIGMMNIDGGGPTSIPNSILDGGFPTSIPNFILDGGGPIAIVEGGSPITIPDTIVDGGGPGSIFDTIIDGGALIVLVPSVVDGGQLVVHLQVRSTLG